MTTEPAQNGARAGEQAGARQGQRGRPAEHVPPPPWQRTPNRAARRRHDPISKEGIVAVAIRLMDAEGFDALSMRRVAEDLGTGAASLYWHVGSKDGLLDLVFDELIGEVIIPDPDPRRWREQVKDLARAQRAGTLRHPYLVRLSIGRIPMGPNALVFSERSLAILRAGGLPPDLAVRASHLLISTVNGFTIDETGVSDAEPDAAAPIAEAAAAAAAYLATLPPERFPNLVSLAPEYAKADRDKQFELLIDIFVDGLARLAAAG